MLLDLYPLWAPVAPPAGGGPPPAKHRLAPVWEPFKPKPRPKVAPKVKVTYGPAKISGTDVVPVTISARLSGGRVISAAGRTLTIRASTGEQQAEEEAILLALLAVAAWG